MRKKKKRTKKGDSMNKIYFVTKVRACHTTLHIHIRKEYAEVINLKKKDVVKATIKKLKDAEHITFLMRVRDSNGTLLLPIYKDYAEKLKLRKGDFVLVVLEKLKKEGENEQHKEGQKI